MRKPIRRNIHLGSGDEGQRRLESLEQIAAELDIDPKHGPGLSRMIQMIADRGIGMFHIKSKFSEGSRWQAPGTFHPDPSHATDEPFVATVHTHTVGSGQKRNEDAGVMFRTDDGAFFEVKDSLALDSLVSVE